MPVVLDDLASIVGIIGFSAACFENCVKGLLLLSKARSAGRDVSGISLMIELELHKLHGWAVEAGLSTRPPILLIDPQDISVVHRVLKHLDELVSDLDQLKLNYGLQLQETTENLPKLDEHDTALNRLGIRANDGCQSFLAGLFKRKSKPWKVLKWVTYDEPRVQRLLEKVKVFIHELQQILDRTRQARMAKAIDMLLRNAVQNTASEQDLHMIGMIDAITPGESSVAAAARFKKHGLLLGVMNVENPSVKFEPQRQLDSSNSSPQLNKRPHITPRYSNSKLAEMRLSTKSLSIKTYNPRESRVLARFEGNPVLLEFRNESGSDPEWTKDRICKISAFLQDFDSSFHGLSCRGYTKVYNRYAYVFDLAIAKQVSKDNEHLPSFRTLRDLLDAAMMPSLNLRVAIATTILETLLQLHTSGWLHKELRSDNVLFFLNSIAHINDFIQAPMYITGYTYARADESPEMTERPESELEADLYRHPAYLSQPPKPFCKEFDMFSVGCVLLEIGLWCSLSTILRKMTDRPEYNNVGSRELMKVRHELLGLSKTDTKSCSSSKHRIISIKHDILSRLEASMGKAYTAIVGSLLAASDISADESPLSTKKPYEESEALQLEMDCLERLNLIYDVL